MQTAQNNLSHQTKAFFLLQGQSISKLYNILNSNVFVHHLRNWFSVLLEISLYLTFIVTVVVMVLIPTDMNLFLKEDVFDATVSINYRDFANVMMGLKIFILILSLPILAFAILLGRNRKKNNLIRKAFKETEKMKTDFDKALNELMI